MTTAPVPVVSGLRQTLITVDNGPAIRAWVGFTAASGTPAACIPLTDLRSAVRALPHLRLTFLGNGAVLSCAGRDRMYQLPLVFVERVGLKCYDLTEAAGILDISEPAAMDAAA